MPFEYIVTADEGNLRADKIVKNICNDVGYAFVQKLFRLHKIRSNGEKINASEKLKNGDVIKIFANINKRNVDDHVFNQKLFNRLRSMIVYDNDDFFAINKPARLAVQLGTKILTCVETFIKSYPNCECRLVHRIDKDTSGVLLIAKNKQAARDLTKLFRENKIRKTYLAVVTGKVLGSGIIENFLEKSFAGNEEKIKISMHGKRAITIYKPLKLIGDNTLLELKPLTGRKHQLRVHCAEALSAPIIGDKKYNKNSHSKEMLLHAYKIFIEDLKIEITAEIPKYFDTELP